MCFTTPVIGPYNVYTIRPTANNYKQFEDCLNGFSSNVKIIEKFKLKSQIRHMASKDVLLDVLEKFTSRMSI
jgi:type I restriction enzyme M protein